MIGLMFYHLRSFSSSLSSSTPTIFPSSGISSNQHLSEKACIPYCPKVSSIMAPVDLKASCPPVQECKCYSISDTPPGNDGQVTMKTTFGKALYNLAKQEDVRTVLEIGTWFGGGKFFIGLIPSSCWIHEHSFLPSMLKTCF